MERIRVVGMGPGHPDYLLPVSRAAAEECSFLFGAPRHLDLFPDHAGERVPLSGPMNDALDAIEESRARGLTAVLVSGDPTLYSYTSVLLRRFARSDLEIYPGVSSVQVAACRLVLTREQSEVVSVHGRELAVLDAALARGSRLFILTDESNGPAAVARYIVETAGLNRVLWICEDLSLAGERISGPFLSPLTGSVAEDHSSLSVVVVEGVL